MAQYTNQSSAYSVYWISGIVNVPPWKEEEGPNLTVWTNATDHQPNLLNIPIYKAMYLSAKTQLAGMSPWIV